MHRKIIVLLWSNLLSLINARTLLASSSSKVSRQGTSYASNAEAALSVLQQWYNTGTGLYDTTGWWNSANCITILADLVAVDSNVQSTTDQVFTNTFARAPTQNTKKIKRSMIYPENKRTATVAGADAGWLNGFYDDEGWWALAWIKVYDVTHGQQYLQAAIEIFDDMTGGATTPCGGIWWDKAHTQMGAIENELYLSVAAHLANRVPSNQTYYQNAAQSQWTWFQNSGMINADNTINNGLNSSCQNDGGIVWSYNQGVILGGLVELARSSSDGSLVSAAQAIANAAIANAAIANLTDVNGVLHDVCEAWGCGQDGNQFKGVFMRNLMELQQSAPVDAYKTFIDVNADSIWANDRDSNNTLSEIWSGPFVASANASTHSSAMDALVAAASLN